MPPPSLYLVVFIKFWTNCDLPPGQIISTWLLICWMFRLFVRSFVDLNIIYWNKFIYNWVYRCYIFRLQSGHSRSEYCVHENLSFNNRKFKRWNIGDYHRISYSGHRVIFFLNVSITNVWASSVSSMNPHELNWRMDSFLSFCTKKKQPPDRNTFYIGK